MRRDASFETQSDINAKLLTISDALNDPPHRDGSRIQHSRLHSQLPHEVATENKGVSGGLCRIDHYVPKNSSIGRKTRNRHSDVVINLDHLLLV
jgi:hypothetical protein